MPNLRFPAGYLGDEIAGLTTITAAIDIPQYRDTGGAISLPNGAACFVSASSTTADAQTTKAYYDLEYVWDFGDPDNQTVLDPKTSTLVDPNVQYGPEACFVYNTPGDYIITLTVRGWDGTSFVEDSTTVNVTVVDRATLVSRTIYVDPVLGSDASLDPTSPAAPLRTLATALSDWSAFSSGTRILIKSGTTVQLPILAGTEQITNPNPFIMGVYNGSEPATLTCPEELGGTSWIRLNCTLTAENIIFENLVFDMSTMTTVATSDVFLNLRFDDSSAQSGLTFSDCKLIGPTGTVTGLWAPDLLDLNGTFEEVCFWNFEMDLSNTITGGAFLAAVQDGGWVNMTGCLVTGGTMSANTNALFSIDGCQVHQSIRWSGPNTTTPPSGYGYAFYSSSRGRVNPLATPVTPVTEFDRYIVFDNVLATGAEISAFYFLDAFADPAATGMSEDVVICNSKIHGNNALLGSPSAKSICWKDNEIFDNAAFDGAKALLAPLSQLFNNTAIPFTGTTSGITSATAAGVSTFVMLRNKMHKDAADVVGYLADNGFNTCRVIDNAIICVSTNPIFGIAVETVAASAARLTIDYNRYYTDEANPFFDEDDGTIINGGGAGTINFATWQGTFDANSTLQAVASQPFADPANGDFTEVPVAPTAPTALSATASGTDQIDLAWTDNATTETGYEVQRSTGGATGPWVTVTAALPANTVAYSNTGLTANTQYWYRVRALDTATTPSAWSNTATDTTDQSVPADPGVPVLTVLSATSIRVQFTDNSTNEDDFDVQRTGDVGGSPDAGSWANISASPLAAVAGTGSTVQVDDTGLSAATIYWYRVRATNALAGDSNWVESAASATTLPAPPSAPTLLVQDAVSTTFVDISWTDNASDETGFEVERAPDVAGAAGTYAQIGTTGANVVTFRDSGLSPSSTFWYRVRAVNTGGSSSYSNAIQITTSDAPITVGISDEQVRKLEVLWRAFNHRAYTNDDTVPFFEEYENENPAGTNPAYVAPVCLSVGEIFGNSIPTPAPGVTTSDIEFVDCWPMRPRSDRTVAGGEIVFLAIRPVSEGGSADTEYGDRLDKFIPPFYDSTYEVVIKLQPDDVTIDGNHSSEAYFDYNTGVLTLLDPLDLTGGKYLEITGHRYKGPTLATRLNGLGGGGTGSSYTRFDLINLSGDKTLGVPWTSSTLLVNGSPVNDLDTNFVETSLVYANGNKLVYGVDYTLGTQGGNNVLTLLNGSVIPPGGDADRYVGRDCDEIEILAVIT